MVLFQQEKRHQVSTKFSNHVPYPLSLYLPVWKSVLDITGEFTFPPSGWIIRLFFNFTIYGFALVLHMFSCCNIHKHPSPWLPNCFHPYIFTVLLKIQSSILLYFHLQMPILVLIFTGKYNWLFIISLLWQGTIGHSNKRDPKRALLSS